MASATSPHFWARTISGLTVRINGALWLERFSPGAFAVAVAASIAIYALRRLHVATDWGWVLLAAGLVVAGGVSWLRMRRHRFSRTDARVLLEYRLRLDTGLTAAEAGLAPWPARRPVPAGMLRWRSPAVTGWLGAAAVLVLAGVWLPVPATDSVAVRPIEKPPALMQTEAWLEALSKLDVIEPASVEPLAARAEELSRLSPEKQYAHSGLEAADALREQTSAAMQGLAHALENASAALMPMEQAGSPLTTEQLKSVGERLEAALRGMREGSLKVSPDLLKACEACAGNPRALTPGEAAQLRKSLAQAGGQLRGVRGAEGAGAQIAGISGIVMMPGAAPGQGGVNRGPGEAPLSFSDTASDTGPGKTETVSNNDLSRAAMGDLLGTQTGEHDLDPSRAQGITSGGAPAATAAGGEAVWVNRLTPAERAALSSFFK
ncbi:MAG: hypothetical protein K0R17_2416 [Rariglobus sp.]|jgi:hypothetical protein|nr:hypothetical protein [Rariglobus sp.]